MKKSVIYEAIWDQRDRLADELKSKGLLPERTLYLLRADGGVSAVGFRAGNPAGFALEWGVSGYQLTALANPLLTAETFEKQAQGFGGLFGAGEKGARGWLLRVFDGERLALEASLLPGITAAADLLYREDRFLNGRRRRADVPHWQLAPLDGPNCEQLTEIWKKLLPGRTL